jgi:diadenosine tetraphosphatase ApaH/serine/threonine PP2A family protein phosphatase
MLSDLGPEPIEWLRGLPATAVFENEVLLCHGSPTDDLCYLLEDVASGRPQVRDGASKPPAWVYGIHAVKPGT